MLYSKNLEEHMSLTREELRVADSLVFNAGVKELFDSSVLPAKEKLYLITVVAKLFMEEVIANPDNISNDVESFKKIKEYIDVYLDGINVYNFHHVYDEASGLYGYILIVYLDNDETTMYKVTSKFYLKDIVLPDVETIMNSIMKYEDNEDE